MIKVMVVEDEPPIAKSICKLVQEYSDDISVVNISINGKRALEYLERETVDIVFSDIKMPIMGGIELSKNLNLMYPDTVVIILSGFQEFEYARTAILYGVSNYLLKPISRLNIYEALNKAVNEINIKNIEKEKKNLLNALNDRGQSQDLLKLPNCAIIILCIGALPSINDETALVTDDLYKCIHLEEKINSIFKEGDSFIYINGKTTSEKTLVFCTENKERIDYISKTIYKYLIANYDFTITMVASHELVFLNEVHSTFLNLRKILYNRLKLFVSQLVFENSEEKLYNVYDTSLLKSKAFLSLKTKNTQAVETSISDIIDFFVKNEVRQIDFIAFFNDFIKSYFADKMNLLELSNFKSKIQVIICNSLLPEKLSSEITIFFIEYLKSEQISEKSVDTNQYNDILDYIKINYKNNINYTELSKIFKIPANEIARKFKNIYNMSLSEYINNLKIEISKEKMNKNKNIMIKEVALELGFSDQYYFSKTFKKITGIWPTEYQKKLLEGNYEKTKGN